MPGPMLITKVSVQNRQWVSLPHRADSKEASDTVLCDQGEAQLELYMWRTVSETFLWR